MNWGHDYGALIDIWAHDYGGILDAKVSLTPGQEPQLIIFPRSLLSGPDPLNIPEVAQVFESSATLSAVTSSPVVVQPARMMEGGDRSVFSNGDLVYDSDPPSIKRRH